MNNSDFVLGLCVPVTHALGRELPRAIYDLGYRALRVDLHYGPFAWDHERTREQLKDAVHCPEMQFTFLVGHGTMLINDSEPWTHGALLRHVQDTMIKMGEERLLDRKQNVPILEIGNEPDLAHERWRGSPVELANTYEAIRRLVESFSPDVRVLTPSVSNLNSRGLGYLRAMYGGKRIGSAAECAVHRYPNDGDPMKPHDGFKNREEEVSDLRKIIGARPFHITETGFARFQFKGRECSENYRADVFDREIKFWRDAGAASVYWYQLNCGRWSKSSKDDEKRMATYGIRGIDGRWLPIAYRASKV